MIESARSLLVWGDLEARRRARIAGGLAAVPGLAYAALGGGLLAAAMCRSLGVFGESIAGNATPLSGSRLWLAVMLGGQIVVLFGAPFRLYWRHDSALLGRLSISGRALFRVALIRGVRASGYVLLVAVMGALPLGYWLDWGIALRHLALAGVTSLGAGLLGSAVALGAGAFVSSDKAQAVLDNMGGEFRAPKTSWLGVLPGLAATGVVLLVIASADWVVGAPVTAIGPAPAVLGAAAFACVASVWLADVRSERSMISALREVSALDQERLAHIDLTEASPLENAWSRALLRSSAARLVYDKDVRLSRRRYPVPYFLGLVGVLALWGIAAGAPTSMIAWSGVVLACLGAYCVIMARRSQVPPIEHPRLLSSLAIGAANARRAKGARVIAWLVTYMLVGAIPVVLRAPDPVAAAVPFAILGVVTLVAASAASN